MTINKGMFEQDLQDKTVVVTGAAGFIGKFIVEKLLELGVNVIAVDLKPEGLSKMCVTKSENSLFIRGLDLRESGALENDFSKILNEFEVIDGLVNGAAYNQIIQNNAENLTVEGFPIQEWESTFKVNVLAPMILIRTLVNRMGESRHLSVINIASIFGHLAPDQRIYRDSKLNSNVAYGPSKAALIQLTRYLAAYYQGTNIRINSISPGGIKRSQPEDFIERYANKTVSGRMGERDDLLGVIVFLLSKHSQWITGTDIRIDGGYSIW